MANTKESDILCKTSVYQSLKRKINQGASDAEVKEVIYSVLSEEIKNQRERLLDIRRAETLLRNFHKEDKKEILPLFLAAMGGMASEKMVLRSRRAGVDLRPIVSFTACMNRRAYKKQKNKASVLEGRIISKDDGYRFAKELKLTVSETLCQGVAATELPLRKGIAVKPVNSEGGRGVYLIHEEDHIQCVKSGNILTSIEALKSSIDDDLRSNLVTSNLWMAEKIIYEDSARKIAGRDFKFYCFYGKCPVVLEVVRYPFKGYTWWSEQRKSISVGKYESLDFKGMSPPAEYIDLAKRISLSIPAPFIRIDFIHSEEGCFFGEFTGHPGDYERFSIEYDLILGEEYLHAEARLFEDLLSKKDFSFFAKKRNGEPV